MYELFPTDESVRAVGSNFTHEELLASQTVYDGQISLRQETELCGTNARYVRTVTGNKEYLTDSRSVTFWFAGGVRVTYVVPLYYTEGAERPGVGVYKMIIAKEDESYTYEYLPTNSDTLVHTNSTIPVDGGVLLATSEFDGAYTLIGHAADAWAFYGEEFLSETTFIQSDDAIVEFVNA